MFIRFGNTIINLATGERWVYASRREGKREHIRFEYPNMPATYIYPDTPGYTEFFEKVFTVDSGKLFYAQDILTSIPVNTLIEGYESED